MGVVLGGGVIAATMYPCFADTAKDVSPVPASTQPSSFEPASPEFLKAIQDKLRSVTTVQTDFVQTKQLAMFDHKVTLRGRLALEKPDRLIWIVKEPVGYAVSIRNSQLKQWDSETGKTQTIGLGDEPTFKAVTQQIKGWFLGDYETLNKAFDVQVAGKKPLTLVFTPKKDTVGQKFLVSVTMTFNEDELYIRDLLIHEQGGDVTTLEFINTRLNQPIKPDVWDIPPHE